MKVYTVIRNATYNGETRTTNVEVFESYFDALTYMESVVAEIKATEDYSMYEESKDSFLAYDLGEGPNYHFDEIFIEAKETVKAKINEDTNSVMVQFKEQTYSIEDINRELADIYQELIYDEDDDKREEFHSLSYIDQLNEVFAKFLKEGFRY